MCCNFQLYMRSVISKQTISIDFFSSTTICLLRCQQKYYSIRTWQTCKRNKISNQKFETTYISNMNYFSVENQILNEVLHPQVLILHNSVRRDVWIQIYVFVNKNRKYLEEKFEEMWKKGTLRKWQHSIKCPEVKYLVLLITKSILILKI